METGINTHERFSTINHEHLDTLVMAAVGDYPTSGLMVVECQDGSWFVEVEFGDEYNAIDGVSKPQITPYIDPQLFTSENKVRWFAFSCIKQIHPELKKLELGEFFSEK